MLKLTRLVQGGWAVLGLIGLDTHTSHCPSSTWPSSLAGRSTCSWLPVPWGPGLGQKVSTPLTLNQREAGGGREAEVSKTERETTVLTQESGKGASLSELSSILLTGLDWNTDIANLIKEGLSCFLPSAPPGQGSSFSVMGLRGAWPGWGTLRRVAAELGQQVFVHASAENARSTISASGHTRARTPGN